MTHRRSAPSSSQRKHYRPWQNLARSLFPGRHPHHHSRPNHHSKGEQSTEFRGSGGQTPEARQSFGGRGRPLATVLPTDCKRLLRLLSPPRSRESWLFSAYGSKVRGTGGRISSIFEGGWAFLTPGTPGRGRHNGNLLIPSGPSGSHHSGTH